MNDRTVLYRSRRSPVLWLLLAVTLAPVPLSAWLVSLPSEARLLADFGSPGAARLWQVAMVLLGSVLFWPLLWLSGRYVTRVDGTGHGVRVTCWTILGPRTAEWTALQGGEHHDGCGHGVPGVQVDAPWTGYRTPAGRKLVVDEQGEFPRGEAALRAAMTHPPR